MSNKKLGKLAQRYARAFLNTIISEIVSEKTPGIETAAGNSLALNEEAASQVKEAAISLQQFSKIWTDELKLRQAVLNPMFEKEERLRALSKIVNIAGLSSLSERFIALLFRRERIAALPEIADAFASLVDKALGVVQVEIRTAQGVMDEEASQIEQMLSKQIEGRLQFQWTVDSSMLGGLLIRYGEKVIDGSLSGRLERLQQSLIGG